MYPSTRRCTVLFGASVTLDAAQEVLADVSNLFASGCLSDGMNWISFPVRGPSRRLGGDHKLAASVQRRFKSFGGSVGVGVADTAFAAFMAAHSEVTTVVPAKADKEFLAPVPLRVLSDLLVAPSDLIDTLIHLGYKTLGSLALVDHVLLRDRFGTDGVRMWHLCNGNEISRTEFSEPHEELIREVAFEEPLQLAEQIVFGVRAVVDALVSDLAQNSKLCTQFTLTLKTEHAEECERVWHFASGFTARAMLERARWQLEEWLHATNVTAGVVLARFCVHATRPSNSEQLSLWGDHSGTDVDAMRLVGKLSATFGAEAVCLAQWRGGRDATEIFAMVPALDVELTDVENTARMQKPAHHEGPWSGLLPSPLPAVALTEPERIVLFDVADNAVGVTRRCELTAIPQWVVRADGARQEILTWAGPWPIEERWWDPERASRIVQMQIVITERMNLEQPVLLRLQHGTWLIVASYE